MMMHLPNIDVPLPSTFVSTLSNQENRPTLPAFYGSVCERPDDHYQTMTFRADTARGYWYRLKPPEHHDSSAETRSDNVMGEWCHTRLPAYHPPSLVSPYAIKKCGCVTPDARSLDRSIWRGLGRKEPYQWRPETRSTTGLSPDFLPNQATCPTPAQWSTALI